MLVGSALWQRRAREYLDTSDPSLDLAPEIKDAILQYDNGNWDERDVVHWCLPQCRCGRTEASAKSKTRAAVFLSLGNGCCLALEYRWKGVERATAWCYRGRRQHDLFGRAVARTYDAAAVRRAEEEILHAAPGADVVAAKQTVKGKLVNMFIKDDAGGKMLFRALVLNTPVQAFLNNVFKAETARTNFVNRTLLEPAAATSMPVDMLVLQRDVASQHASFISGRAGRIVVQAFIDTAQDFCHPLWSRLNLDRQEHFASALSCLRGSGVAYRRLVFYFEQPKFVILASACHELEEDAATEICNELRRKRETCNGCIDDFTGVWLDRLSDASAPLRKRARLSLQCKLAVTPMSSVAVERKHLLGQECRRPRSRGVALSAGELARRTYQKSASLMNKRQSDVVLANVLRGTPRRCFGRLATECAVQKRMVTNTYKEAKRRLATRRTTPYKQSALGAFKSSRWDRAADAKIGSPANTAEHKRLKTAFDSLNEEDRATYVAMADACSNSRKKLWLFS
jgi:hypothetical protein